ncbi:MAG: uridine monophosphate synthetase [Parcubacteria group bacterium LiPW_39]|nr:MAG: uridine monophosphate synthetase [Parcubacteria group bacterium LiPW_39]
MLFYKRQLAGELFNSGIIQIARSLPQRFPFPIYDFGALKMFHRGLLKKIAFILLATASTSCKPYHYVVGVPRAGQILAEAFCQAPRDGSVKSLLKLFTGLKGRYVMASEYKPGATALLISAVVAAGDNEIAIVNFLTQRHIFVESVLALIDGERGGAEKLEKEGINFYSIFRISELFTYYRSGVRQSSKPVWSKKSVNWRTEKNNSSSKTV